MPQFLFLRGNEELLRRRKIAVAGSRRILKATIERAEQTGIRIAQEGFVMVCGCARGVDEAAQRALLHAGGSLILVPAQPVEELLGRNAYLQKALNAGKLLIVCDTLPDEPFSAPKAIARNHTIYALSDAAIVAAARKGVGGSWRGASDCLRGSYTPVYVLDGEGVDMQGNRALQLLGARIIDVNREFGAQLDSGASQQMDMLSEGFGEADACR